jgi:hypothetical protein
MEITMNKIITLTEEQAKLIWLVMSWMSDDWELPSGADVSVIVKQANGILPEPQFQKGQIEASEGVEDEYPVPVDILYIDQGQNQILCFDIERGEDYWVDTEHVTIFEDKNNG